MSDHWRTLSLGQICNMKYGKMPKETDKVEIGYPIFTGYQVSGNHREYLYDEPKIVVVARGVGGAGDIRMSPARSWITNISIVLDLTDPEIDQKFLFYSLSNSTLRSLRTGSAQPQIIIADILNFDVSFPPLPIQRKIADILSAYDDLIENNTRRIQILEEMAQTIYREWFVHFRFPGHADVEMVETELGLVPAGWDVKPLGDVIELAYGKALKADQRCGGNVPVYGSSGIVGFHDEPLVKGPGIVVGRKGNVGSVFWSDADFYPIDTTFYVVTGVALPFAYYSLQYQNFINNDAAVPGLSRRQAYLLPMIVPPDHLLSTFEDIFVSIAALIRNLQTRNSYLRQTCDLLLPRLVSGEIIS